MKYHLFTAPHRCPPCRALEAQLELIPNWKDNIEYINADEMTDEQMELANKLFISRLPSFTSNDEILKLSQLDLVKKIKEICTSE